MGPGSPTPESPLEARNSLLHRRGLSIRQHEGLARAAGGGDRCQRPVLPGAGVHQTPGTCKRSDPSGVCFPRGCSGPWSLHPRRHIGDSCWLPAFTRHAVERAEVWRSPGGVVSGGHPQLSDPRGGAGRACSRPKSSRAHMLGHVRVSTFKCPRSSVHVRVSTFQWPDCVRPAPTSLGLMQRWGPGSVHPLGGGAARLDVCWPNPVALPGTLGGGGCSVIPPVPL